MSWQSSPAEVAGGAGVAGHHENPQDEKHQLPQRKHKSEYLPFRDELEQEQDTLTPLTWARLVLHAAA